ncbi:MAG: hypothetical protein AUI36_37305 [Cyanobacteria bacterium 13_1_40CM_2_61_4]|nr:MAG: hypothetical protein AUI36_37305 [Cyanobacteria bacterium 13_1_40CM_2_61_4]
MLTCSFFFLVQGACWAEGQQALNAAVAEADRTDSGWGYDALQAARPKVADKDNEFMLRVSGRNAAWSRPHSC